VDIIDAALFASASSMSSSTTTTTNINASNNANVTVPILATEHGPDAGSESGRAAPTEAPLRKQQNGRQQQFSCPTPIGAVSVNGSGNENDSHRSIDSDSRATTITERPPETKAKQSAVGSGIGRLVR